MSYGLIHDAYLYQIWRILGFYDGIFLRGFLRYFKEYKKCKKILHLWHLKKVLDQRWRGEFHA